MAQGSLGREARRLVRAAAYCFNVHTLLLCSLSCASVWAAGWLGLSPINIDFSLVSLSISLPLTLNLTQSFTRRERALMMLGELKASVVAMYWMHRDWVQDGSYPASLGDDRHAWAVEFANVAMEFLTHLQAYLTTHEGYESLSEARLSVLRPRLAAGLLLGETQLHPDPEALTESFIGRVQHVNRSLPGHRHLVGVYRSLSRMSVMNELLGFKAGYSKGGEGGMSRTSQYFRYLMAQTEQLRLIKIYRTPFMLRHCCSLLIYLGALLLGPYFRHVGTCDAHDLGPDGACPAPYVAACVFAVICRLLLGVQASSEMPFDGSGMDDVFLELTEEFADVLDQGAPERIPDSACGDVRAVIAAELKSRVRHRSPPATGHSQRGGAAGAMSSSDDEDAPPQRRGGGGADANDAALPALFWESMPDNAEEHPDYVALQALAEESTPEERAENFKTQGNGKLRVGLKAKNRLLLREAIEFYDKGLALRCGDAAVNAALHNNRCHVNSLLGNWRSALQDSSAALRLDPGNAKATFRGARAALKLGEWARCEELLAAGLAADPAGQELLQVQQELGAARRRHEDQLAAQAAAREAALAPARKLAAALALKGYRLTLPEVQVGAKRPRLDAEGAVHWPVMLMFPETGQQDVVEDWHEDSTVADHLDVMFGPDAPPLEWDAAGEYSRRRVRLHYLSNAGAPLGQARGRAAAASGPRPAAPPRAAGGAGPRRPRATAAAAAAAAAQEQLVAAMHGEWPDAPRGGAAGPRRYGAGASRWVAVDEGRTLREVLLEPGHAVPGVPLFWVVAEGSDRRAQQAQSSMMRPRRLSAGLCLAATLVAAAAGAAAAGSPCREVPDAGGADQSPTAPRDWGRCTGAMEQWLVPNSHWCKQGPMGLWPTPPSKRAQQCLKFGRATIYRGPIYGSSPEHKAACNKVLRGSDDAAMVAVSSKYLKTYQGGWAADGGACGQCMCVRLHGADDKFNSGLQTEQARKHVGLTFLAKVGDRCAECDDDHIDILQDRPFSWAPFDPKASGNNPFAPYVNAKDGLRGFRDPDAMRSTAISPETVGAWNADWQWVPCEGWSHDKCASLMRSMNYKEVWPPAWTAGLDSFTLRPIATLRGANPYTKEPWS
ncbi:ttc4 [Scenedesmus sp. PABB004]|nr:ttc4 [Scenedesmus sp. PABB004]